MDDKLRDKLSKLYELVKRGEAGEREAAQRVLERLLEKYNLHNINLESIDKPLRKFKYSSRLEMYLLKAIVIYFISEEPLNDAKRYLYNEKAIGMPLQHLDFVTVDCAYEYFRRHMKVQWKKTCEPLLKKCRKAKTRNKRREELQDVFIHKYIIASKIYKPEHLKELKPGELSAQEVKDRQQIINVEGGTYNVQVQSAHQLTSGSQQVKCNGEQICLF